MKLSEMNQINKNKENAEKQKSINEKYEELKGCGSDELMQRLVKEIQSQKDQGIFDYENLRSSIEKLKIYLPSENYENMIRIIESLK